MENRRISIFQMSKLNSSRQHNVPPTAIRSGYHQNFNMFRKSMLISLLTKMESAVSETELCKTVTLLDAIVWVLKAWDSVTTETIVKCFKSVGFSSSFRELEISPDLGDDDHYDDDDVPLAVHVQQWLCDSDSDDVPEQLPGYFCYYVLTCLIQI